MEIDDRKARTVAFGSLIDRIGENPHTEEMGGLMREARRRRHTNILSTKEERTTYANAVATGLEQTASAFAEIARKIREDSEALLNHAFTPNMQVLDPRPRVRIEAERPADRENAPIAIRASFLVPTETDQFRQVTIRLIWRDGTIESTEDNSLG